MPSISPYKTGYRARIYINGIQQSKTVPNKFLAKEWLKIKQLEKIRIESGADPHPEGTRKNLTFKKFAPEYLKWCEMHKAKSTLRGDRTSVRQILKHFGSQQMSSLSTKRVEQYNGMRSTEVATATLVRELNCISHMIKIATELGYVKRDPGLHIRSPGSFRSLRSNHIPSRNAKSCSKTPRAQKRRR